MLFMVWVGACWPFTCVMGVVVGASGWCCFQCRVAVVSSSRRAPGVVGFGVWAACSGVVWLWVPGVCACVGWLVCVVWFRMLMRVCASFRVFCFVVLVLLVCLVNNVAWAGGVFAVGGVWVVGVLFGGLLCLRGWVVLLLLVVRVLCGAFGVRVVIGLLSLLLVKVRVLCGV